MADRHYAPRADVWLFDTAQRAEIEEALERWHAERQRDDQGAVPVHALVRTGPLGHGDRLLPDHVQQRRMPDDPAAYARTLYSALHDADQANAGLILIEAPPDAPGWDGVRDRLTRAAR
jgi:L-threonylcarbamoyladenylate synthase